MKKGYGVITAWIVCAVLLSGCVGPPKYRKTFGSSMKKTMSQQIADPMASDRRDTAEGLDGRTAVAVMERYYSLFETKTQKGGILETLLGATQTQKANR